MSGWPDNRNHEAARRHVDSVLRDRGYPEYRRETQIADLLDDLQKELRELRHLVYGMARQAITDEMVDRAIRAWNDWPIGFPLDTHWRRDRSWLAMRRALAAAFGDERPRATSAASGDSVARETTPPSPASEQTEVKP